MTLGQTIKYSAFLIAFSYNFGILDYVFTKYQEHKGDLYCEVRKNKLSSLECGVKFVDKGKPSIYGINLRGFRINKRIESFSKSFRLDEI
ncbi:hypothetical protein J4216_01590 [Candidatus Woesearchaeota archaeon]|nr:hypothetical protein [Candidatus Woesearchaeota archaeon]